MPYTDADRDHEIDDMADWVRTHPDSKEAVLVEMLRDGRRDARLRIGVERLRDGYLNVARIIDAEINREGTAGIEHMAQVRNMHIEGAQELTALLDETTGD